MKKVVQILKMFLWILPGGIFILFAFSYMLFVQPFVWVASKIRERQFKEYLKQLEGKNFFCYNNRSKSLEFIQENVLPNLPDSVEVIFVNGRTPESAYDRKFISHGLYRFKNYHGFPHLLKIRNGEPIDESLNNDLFNVIENNKPVEVLLRRIAAFFDLHD